jgi:probable phosphoglycerate mutase
MTTLLLVRHAMCDPVGRAIAGRAPGVSLNAEGRAQAERLAERLARRALDAIYASPLERARETADAIAAPHALAVCVDAGLNEIDFGDWTGRTLAELEPVAAWRAFNSRRRSARIPGGESMRDAQLRAVAAVERLCERHPSATVLAVSHGDIIKGIVAHYLGMSLDHLARLEIAPASVSVLAREGSRATVLALNTTGDLS